MTGTAGPRLRELQSAAAASSAVLVVPPFECAWLSGDEFALSDAGGCLSFESKGALALPSRCRPSACLSSHPPSVLLCVSWLADNQRGSTQAATM